MTIIVIVLLLNITRYFRISIIADLADEMSMFSHNFKYVTNFNGQNNRNMAWPYVTRL